MKESCHNSRPHVGGIDGICEGSSGQHQKYFLMSSIELSFSEQTWSKRLLSIPYLRDEADPKETTTTSSLSFTSSVHYPDSQTSSLIDKPGIYIL